ncbi:3-hydroxyacyl-CoA dehydrogenase [Actinocorallia herbida]|uniref:3-hydroxyacyl-CoA dehydrogenase n=1 Tax=Actinocorallia herbida TaxID=58109 RepID=A0A3N1D3B6_9ACTN|nr:3-hydroxyacyl-CoA dehydrogenase [Actinocorallia herbida]ROO88037.1 3-hydroxyacyl-CoA dehydrogenase [Actinocorallia herbida]
MHQTIAVVGAGTMGTGIAQVAALAGHPVLLMDTAPGAAERAVALIREQVAALVERGKLTADPETLRLTAADDVDALAPADIVIEAVIEDLDVKRRLFAEVEAVVTADCVLASNTSSLSPSAIAAGVGRPDRVVGLHFFNPVPRMRLVEVIPGAETTEAVVSTVIDLVTAWGKTAVRVAPTPGFIVNRIARPYYAEAWRLLDERAAAPETIDTVLTGAGGFPLGPFALMDLIGHDVNESVTRSVWEALGFDARFTPAPAQRALVASGRLGRKSGRGVYRHDVAPPEPARPADKAPCPLEVVDNGAADLHVLLARSGVAVLDGGQDEQTLVLPSGAILIRSKGVTATELAAEHGAPVVVVDRTLDDATASAIAVAASDSCPSAALTEATGLLQAAGLDVYVLDDIPGLIVTRTVAMIVNLAVEVVQQGIASAEDVDTAMRLGAGHPLGPIAWGDRWGAGTVHEVLAGLQRSYGDPRYRPGPLLRRRALAGRTLA